MERIFLVSSDPKGDGPFSVSLSLWKVPVPKKVHCDCWGYTGGLTDFLVPGHEELRMPDLHVKGFLAGDETPPFVGLEQDIRWLATLMSGVSVVRVGYETWDDDFVLESKRFALEPQLAALFVTGNCSRAVSSRTGCEFSACPVCGGYEIGQVGDVCPVHATWDGSDLFNIPGSPRISQVIITEKGRQILDQEGFTNVKYAEIRWALPDTVFDSVRK